MVVPIHREGQGKLHHHLHQTRRSSRMTVQLRNQRSQRHWLCPVSGNLPPQEDWTSPFMRKMLGKLDIQLVSSLPCKEMLCIIKANAVRVTCAHKLSHLSTPTTVQGILSGHQDYHQTTCANVVPVTMSTSRTVKNGGAQLVQVSIRRLQQEVAALAVTLLVHHLNSGQPPQQYWRCFWKATPLFPSCISWYSLGGHRSWNHKTTNPGG